MNINLDRRITIEQPVAGQDATYGASAPTWTVLAAVWAERRPVLPSRSESVRQGLEQARDQVRYRIRYRDDLDSSMRIRDGADLLQIVGGPAEMGRRDYLEFVAERFATAGGT